jgi:hypothetical protein
LCSFAKKRFSDEVAQMKRFNWLVMFVLLANTAFAQECSTDDFGSFCETKAAVLRVLSYPVYTGWDEKVLNRAGDMAALAVIKSVSMDDLHSPEKARQILLILNLAFAAPQLIPANTNRRPMAAMLLLDYLSGTNYGKQQVSEIENTRKEIQHSKNAGQPYEVVALKGDPLPDLEHTQWVGSVLRWTHYIKPGMTRNDLLKVYTTEGGISTSTRRTYVLKGCSYIKVDVEFKAVGRPQRDQEGRVPLVQDGRDIITHISRPYLEYSVVD